MRGGKENHYVCRLLLCFCFLVRVENQHPRITFLWGAVLLSLAGYHPCVIFSSCFARRQAIIQASPYLKFWKYWQRFRLPSINMFIFDIFRSARTSFTTSGGPACVQQKYGSLYYQKKICDFFISVIFLSLFAEKVFFRAKTHFLEIKEPQTPPCPYLGTIRQKNPLKEKVIKKIPWKRLSSKKSPKKRSFPMPKISFDIDWSRIKKKRISIEVRKKMYCSRLIGGLRAASKLLAVSSGSNSTIVVHDELDEIFLKS